MIQQLIVVYVGPHIPKVCNPIYVELTFELLTYELYGVWRAGSDNIGDAVLSYDLFSCFVGIRFPVFSGVGDE